MAVCRRCKRWYAGNAHKCNEVVAFKVWMDEFLEKAVEEFKQSDYCQFELYYDKWRSTHKSP